MVSKRILFIVLALMALFIASCSKDDDSADLASGISGTYEGNWNVQNNANGTCVVTKVGNTTAKLTMSIAGVGVPVPDVTLSDSGNGKINLNFSDSDGSISGSVQNSLISVTITDGTTSFKFTGSKQQN